jgi:hypothetical protein
MLICLSLDLVSFLDYELGRILYNNHEIIHLVPEPIKRAWKNVVVRDQTLQVKSKILFIQLLLNSVTLSVGFELKL